SSAAELKRGENVLISVRPEDVRLSENKPDGENVIQGRIHLKVFLGECIDYQVEIGGQLVLARVHPSFNVVVGTPVYMQIDQDKCVAFQDDDTKQKQAA